MTARKPKAPDLAALMDERGVSPEELAAVTRIAPERVAEYVEGAEQDADDAYLIRRALDGSYRARLALDTLRRRKTESLLPPGVKSFPKIVGFPGTEPRRDGGAPQ